MEQPTGFVDSNHPNFVCCLHKSIYGLKQAPRAWFTSLFHSLPDLGFLRSQVDHSLFTYHCHNTHVFLLVYVDDIIVTGNNDSVVTEIISKLQSDFVMKDLGPFGFFLGIQVDLNSAGLHLRQSKYITDLLDKVNMSEAKPYRAPCISGSKLSQLDGELPPNPTEYRHVVGALQYVTLTRPDIPYSVNQLCQHMQAPTTTYWTAAKRVLRY